MRFLYRFQDPARGVVEREISAPSEAEAYSRLRKSGIRPIKVWAKPGFLNRMMIGKRWGLIVVLSAALIVSLAGLRGKMPNARPANGLNPMPRHQFTLEHVDFKYMSESALVSFARPGDIMQCPDFGQFASDIQEALATPIEAGPNDTAGQLELKRVVIGLKNEISLSVTSGSRLREVYDGLVARQEMECEYRQTVIEELSDLKGDDSFATRLSAVNQSFRLSGLEEIAESEIYSDD